MKYFLLLILTINLSQAFVPKVFKVNFTEEHKGRFSKKNKKIKGTLFYKFPKNIRIEVYYPSKTIFVSNNETSWYFKPPFDESEPNEVTISKNKDYFLITLFDLLQGRLKNNKYYSLKKQRNKIELLLKKKASKEVKIIKITFLFKNSSNFKFANLIQMTLLDFDKKIKTFKFNTLDLKPTIVKATFNFVIPPNTRKSY